MKEGTALNKKPRGAEGRLRLPAPARPLSFRAGLGPQGPRAAILLPPGGTFLFWRKGERAGTALAALERGLEARVPAESGRPGPDASRQGWGAAGGTGLNRASEQRLGDGRAMA